MANAALDIAKPVREWRDVDKKTFREEILPANEPAVLRGLVRSWPAVTQGKTSPRNFADYIKQYDTGAPVETFMGPPQIGGRFFYNEEMSGFNFLRKNETLSASLERILNHLDDEAPPALYTGAAPVPQNLRAFGMENHIDLPGEGAVARIWIGNAATVSTHYDLSDNIACVVAGKRRFTLFPPHQLANLYIGPLDYTMAGQPVSMPSLAAPDFDRYPRFRDALQHALIAELEPGDAIFIPTLWWHNVESLALFNALVNYWWDEHPSAFGSPFETLVHALLTLRDLPRERREEWRRIFDHYIFEQETDATAHLPPQGQGIIGPMTRQNIDKIRHWLMHKISRR